MTDPDAQARADAAARPPGPTDEPSQVPDYSVAVSPRQLAGGFAILAAILVLIVRSRRRRGARKDAD